ncbi:MAG: TadE/TadG family type IV pilus assembly protein [Burkholderiales bacterium]
MKFMQMRKHKQKGVAAVEMALVLIPLLLLCFVITELGRALYQYNGLVKATRGAARYLSQQSLESPPIGETADTIRLKARSIALCGAPSCNGRAALVTGLTLAMISACDSAACTGTHFNVATGAGAVSLVSVRVGAEDAKFSYISAVPWAVPDIQFGAIGMTMASNTN